MKTLLFLLSVCNSQHLTSFLEVSENPELEAWLDWKNSRPRYSLSFDEMSRDFKPENSQYWEGLFMESRVALCLSLLFFLSLIFLLVLRMRFGLCGGSLLKPEDYTSCARWTPTGLFLTSLSLFLVGGVSLLISSANTTEIVKESIDLTYKHADSVLETLTKMRDTAILLNVKYVHSQDKYIDPRNLDLMIEEALDNAARAEDYETDAKMLDSRRVIAILVLFCVNVVHFVVLLVALSMKFESMVMAIGITFGLTVSLSCLCFVPLTMELVAATDMCECIYECSFKHTHPIKGISFGVYKYDFTYPARLGMLEMEDQVKHTQEMLLNSVNSKLDTPISSAKEARDITRDSNPNLVRDLKSLGHTEKLMLVIARFKRREFIGEYCLKVEKDQCVDLMNNIQVGYLALGILILAFFCGSAGGLVAPRIIEKMKKDEEVQLLSKHNLYGI